MSESPSLNSGESREIKETIGDNYNVECPHCGKQNHNICYGDTNPSKKTLLNFGNHANLVRRMCIIRQSVARKISMVFQQ